MTLAKSKHSIEIHLKDASQLFETLDPFPFRERNLSRDAFEYIIGRAREIPRDAPLEIIVGLPRPTGDADAVHYLDDAISTYFKHRADIVTRELADLFRVGRRTLLVGLLVLGVCLLIDQAASSFVPHEGSAYFLEQGFIILGWVALWRPLEIFLYDWWPPSQDRNLYQRIAASPVVVKFYDT